MLFALSALPALTRSTRPDMLHLATSLPSGSCCSLFDAQYRPSLPLPSHVARCLHARSLVC